MRDNLEKFIQDHRNEFDSAIPSLKVWSDIDKQLAKKKSPTRRSPFQLLKLAASILVLLAVGGVGGMYLSNGKAAHQDEIAHQFPEFQQQQQYYTQQVNLKLNQLEQYDYGSFVQEDLKELDHFILDLKDQLKKAPRGSEQEIIDAMIQNYQTKLAILERVLERLKASAQKEQNPKKHETIDI